MDLLSQYKRAAEGTSDSDPNLANRHHNELHALYKQLSMSAEGREGIIKLMRDENNHVKLWAAAHSLEWVPQEAEKILRELRDSNGPCSFDAEMTLKEFDKGNLTFNY